MTQDHLHSLDRAKAAVKFSEARVALITAREAYIGILERIAGEPPTELVDQVTRVDRALVMLSLVP